MSQLVAQVCHTTLEDASKVARNECTTNTCNDNSILISPEDFISSYCHVKIKGGASITKCNKVVISAFFKKRPLKQRPKTSGRDRK